MGSPLRREIHAGPSLSPRPPETGLVYGRNEQPRSTHDWILYSFQWLVTMVYAVVWGYAIVGVGLNFQGARMTAYLSAVVLGIPVKVNGDSSGKPNGVPVKPNNSRSEATPAG